ncbi:MAG: hypothetical protein Kow0099_11000 [Candidatus Abyssubacteria bacterium]
MRIKTLLIVSSIFWLAITQFGWAADAEDPISRVKLKPESLPSGMELVTDVRATRDQLFGVRTRVGFPLDAVVNQKLIYQSEQAIVSYIFTRDEKWNNYGYSRIIESEGYKSFVFMKDGVTIQIATTSLEMLNALSLMFMADPIHYVKIKSQLLPEEWALMHEYYLLPEDLQKLREKCGVDIESSLIQEFIVTRVKINLRYFSCKTPADAVQLARCLAAERMSILHRIVRSAGTVVVSFESQDEKLIQEAMSLVDLQVVWELAPVQ